MSSAPPFNSEDRFLGKQVDYKFTYDKTLLQPIPRSIEREKIEIKEDSLPFIGFDIWNCYEVSCLGKNGLPVVGIAKIVYPANTKFIIESKSLKLYLNSFNMYKVSNESLHPNDIRKMFGYIIKKDLAEALQCQLDDIRVNVFAENYVGPLTGTGLLNTYKDIIDLDANNYTLGTEDIGIYQEDTSLIQIDEIDAKYLLEKPELKIYTSGLLRSNCKITKQPDWGNIYIGINTPQDINELQLLRYIVSFRNENHFHEEVCETIFKRLNDIISPQELFVMCNYTRRGGIDINPIRASHLYLIDEYFKNYLDMRRLSIKLPRQ